MGKLTVGIFFGGRSSEYEVSLRSAAAVIDHLDADRFEPVFVGITKDGRWFCFRGDSAEIASGDWVNGDCVPAFMSPERGAGLTVFEKDAPVFIRLDAAFPVMHGRGGEDGSIQGLFELAGLPYVGSGVLASADCMDKAVANALFDRMGLPHCKWLAFSRHECDDMSAVAAKVEAELGWPVYVKPANSGSSVGVTRAHGKDELAAAFAAAFEHDRKLVVEEEVRGKELECAVCGNDELTASAVGQIIPPDGFYSYEEKYDTDTTGLAIPARITEAETEQIRSTALRAYRALGCRGLSRVDFFLREDGKVLVNEINTIPGFTKISMYPKLMEYSGTPFKALVTRLFELALEDRE